MGFAIRITAYFDWDMTYFVQETDEERAKRKAYQRAKETWSCTLPDTLEEADASDRVYVETLGTIEQIIL
nr:MAG TPA: hypothetical protein [Caudoviricetes sp.]